MFHAAMRRTLPLCLLSTLATAPLVAQVVKPAVAAPAPVAYVYVATSKGINLYNAASNGKLTLVSGSPFKSTTGLMIGSNQKYFITLGTDWVHSYPVAANGAIGAQVSQINTQSYSGSNCGRTNGAVLDHSGQYLYVLLNVVNVAGVCDAFQTFKIAASGQLTFNGATSTNANGAVAERNLPTILANEKFAYAINDFDFIPEPGQPSDFELFLNGESSFSRESNGTLEYRNFSWSFPATPPAVDPGSWFPLQVTADPSNHLAVAMYPFDPPLGAAQGAQLASFTVDSKGNVSSTNTWKNMPTPGYFPTGMNMSPDGKLLAVIGGGLDVYHFNGAAPITRYSHVTSDNPDWIHWDKANHLYALMTNGKLYVYTVTPTSIAPAPGSPYTTSGPASGLFVVPK